MWRRGAGAHVPCGSVQTYVVKLQRDAHNQPQFVFRTFDEFQELHNKLTILFPLWKLPRYRDLLPPTSP